MSDNGAATAATRALLDTWRLPGLLFAEEEVRSLVDTHIVCCAIVAPKITTAELRKTRREAKQRGDSFIQICTDLFDALALEAKAPLHAKFAPSLANDLSICSRALAQSLEPLVWAIQLRTRLATAKKQDGRSGPRKHPSWSPLIRRLAELYAKAGGKPGDRMFREGLRALNAQLPAPLDPGPLRQRIVRALNPGSLRT